MNNTISKNLKALRIKNKLTQDKLCEDLKEYGCVISRSTYTKYELGNHTVPYDVLATIVKYYDVSADFILGLKK